MFRFVLGVAVGFLIYDLNLVPHMITFFNESGLNQTTISYLESLKNE